MDSFRCVVVYLLDKTGLFFGNDFLDFYRVYDRVFVAKRLQYSYISSILVTLVTTRA